MKEQQPDLTPKEWEYVRKYHPPSFITRFGNPDRYKVDKKPSKVL